MKRKSKTNAIPTHHSERVKGKRFRGKKKRKAQDFYLLNMIGSVKAVLFQSLNQIWPEQETAVLQCLLKRGSSGVFFCNASYLAGHPVI